METINLQRRGQVMKIIRSLRLISGLILFAFVVMHLINHAFGLASIDMMERARKVLLFPWANVIGGFAIFASLVIHSSLGLYAVYRRPNLRTSAFDVFQLALGLAIPLLLIPHAVVMLIQPLFMPERMSYSHVLETYWITEPWSGLRLVIGVVAVWIHGCMGLFVWMQVQRWWARVAAIVYPLIVIIPVLALLGFAEGGKEVIAGNSDSGYSSGVSDSYYGTDAKEYESGLDTTGGYYANSESVSDDEEAKILAMFARTVNRAMLLMLAMFALTFIARWWRLRGNANQVQVRYINGHTVSGPIGSSLLDISRLNDVIHGSLCGGKGRCGTCQVRIISGAEHLPEKNAIERDLLIQLSAPQDVRLACQTIPDMGTIVIERLLRREATADDARALANSGEMLTETLTTVPEAS